MSNQEKPATPAEVSVQQKRLQMRKKQKQSFNFGVADVIIMKSM